MDSHTVFAAIAIAFAVSPTPLRAQQVPAPGTRVRISLDANPKVIGRVVRQLDDTLEVAQDEHLGTVRIPIPQIRQIELTRGAKSMAPRGLLIGATVGTGLGVAIAAGASRGWGDLTQKDVLKVATLNLGLLGALTGLLIGAASSEEDWFVAPRADSGGRVVVGAGLRFRF